MAETKGNIGQFTYTHIYIPSRGHRFEWDKPPLAGTKLVNRTSHKELTVDGIDTAGLILYTGADGVQCASFPTELETL